MLSSDQKRKLQRGYQWKNAQEKANFYKNKRAQLKDWLDKLPDMLLIFEMAVHQKQIKNMKLEDKLADLIKFTDAFLDAINPLPVAENPHVNRNVVFQNALIDVTKSLVELQQEGFDERLIVPMDGRKILLYSRFWAATKKRFSVVMFSKNTQSVYKDISIPRFSYISPMFRIMKENVMVFLSRCLFLQITGMSLLSIFEWLAVHVA